MKRWRLLNKKRNKSGKFVMSMDNFISTASKDEIDLFIMNQQLSKYGMLANRDTLCCGRYINLKH